MYKILVNIKAVLKIPSEPGSGEERLEGKWFACYGKDTFLCLLAEGYWVKYAVAT